MYSPWTAPHVDTGIASGRSTSVCPAIGPKRSQQKHPCTPRHISSVAMGFITGFVSAANRLQLHQLTFAARRRHTHHRRPLHQHLPTHTKPHNTSRSPTTATPSPHRILRAQEARTRAHKPGSTRRASRDGQGPLEQKSRGGCEEGLHNRLAESTGRGRGQGERHYAEDQGEQQMSVWSRVYTRSK